MQVMRVYRDHQKIQCVLAVHHQQRRFAKTVLRTCREAKKGLFTVLSLCYLSSDNIL